MVEGVRHVHVHVHHDDARIVERLDRLTEAVMALDLSRLTNEVSEIRDAGQSAVALIQAIAEELRNAGGNQAEVDALADQLDASGQQLADAVAANTPSGGGGGETEPPDGGVDLPGGGVDLPGGGVEPGTGEGEGTNPNG